SFRWRGGIHTQRTAWFQAVGVRARLIRYLAATIPDTDRIRLLEETSEILLQEFHAATVKETPVSKLRVSAFTVSADGFGAGPDQGRDQPLGRGGEELHRWFVPTRTFQRTVLRRDDGTTGVDNDFAARSFENLGAWIMGRNMFGPVRG